MSSAPGPRPARHEARPAAAAPERFGWHPEPELLGLDDAAASRPAMERLGAETWALAMDYLYGQALRRAMGEPTAHDPLREEFFGPLGAPAAAPDLPTPSNELLAEFAARLVPHQLNGWHPRTLSYFTPSPLVMSVIGEVLAQVTNQGVDVWHSGPTAAFVEEEVARWLCDLVGYGPRSFGLTTSGGVMANFIALSLARDVHLARLLGVDRAPRGAALEGVRAYASDQAHFSIARSLDALGFPSETLSVIPADERFRLQAAPVAEQIARDRAAGLRPFAIAAVAGSTNTGSVDAIGDLADLAEREGLWFHVDAAYGGAARFSARDAGRVPHLDRADTVTIDPHKWFFQAFDIGAILVREGSQLEATFGGRRPEYYREGERHGGAGPAAAGTPGAEAPGETLGGALGRSLDEAGDDRPGGPISFYKLGLEGTRRFRALKLWLSWKHLGSRGFGRLIERNNDLAAYLARRCSEADDLEALPAVPELSAVCFRHLPGGATAAAALDPAELDAHQERLQSSLEASGDAWLSTTRLRGRTWLRAGILNYLTTDDDLDRILERLRELAGR